MSFLKDFKEDLSLAVSELLPQEVKEDEEDLDMEEAFSEREKESQQPQGKTAEPKQKGRSHLKSSEKRNQKPVSKEVESKDSRTRAKEEVQADVGKEKDAAKLKKQEPKDKIDLDALLRKEPFFQKPDVKEMPPEKETRQKAAMEDFLQKTAVTEEKPEIVKPELKEPERKEPELKELERKEPERKEPERKEPERKEPETIETETVEPEKFKTEIAEEKKIMDEMMKENVETEEVSLDDLAVIPEVDIDIPAPKKSNEVATITAGTKINGDIESDGSLEILGTINGNVKCNGKLTITGTIVGNSNADEVYADSAKVEGQINSGGAVKIGLGSVILGNVNATSAVIAGAIRGDIDVHGPVIVDTSAVVMGNIKSRSVQINNGAVIEGFCSQCYSDISVKNFFEDNKIGTEKNENGAQKK